MSVPPFTYTLVCKVNILQLSCFSLILDMLAPLLRFDIAREEDVRPRPISLLHSRHHLMLCCLIIMSRRYYSVAGSLYLFVPRM
jgi:hypothetical protein